MTKFGERVRELRLEKSLSQLNFAEMLGVDQRAVSHWEVGERECSFETLCRIARILECDVNYLLGFEELSS